MDFSEKFKEYIKIFEEYAEKNAFVGEKEPKAIYDAMEYSLFAGGKRIRPVLALASCNCFSDEICAALPFALAIEKIHTYSLIHDDLPCMDNDDVRRGRPTNHKVFGETTALLAGDGLLSSAFETIAAATKGAASICAFSYIAKACSISGMLGGQVLDLDFEHKECTPQMILKMYKMKTSALLKCSCMAGARMGGADDNAVSAFGKYGELIGLAFQIQDDILDAIGDEKILGKPVGSDEENNKNTILKAVGLEKAKEMVMAYTKEAIDLVKAYDKAGFMEKLALFLVERNK